MREALFWCLVERLSRERPRLRCQKDGAPLQSCYCSARREAVGSPAPCRARLPELGITAKYVLVVEEPHEARSLAETAAELVLNLAALREPTLAMLDASHVSRGKLGKSERSLVSLISQRKRGSGFLMHHGFSLGSPREAEGIESLVERGALASAGRQT